MSSDLLRPTSRRLSQTKFKLMNLKNTLTVHISINPQVSSGSWGILVCPTLHHSARILGHIPEIPTYAQDKLLTDNKSTWTYLFVARINSDKGSPRIDWSAGGGNAWVGLIAPGALPAEPHRPRPALEHVVDRRAQIDRQVGWFSRKKASSVACTWVGGGGGIGNWVPVRMFANEQHNWQISELIEI